MRTTGLVAAAGGGTRMGLGPKAFVRLGDATLLELAVANVRAVVDDVVVAVPLPLLAEAGRLLGPSVRLVPGGASRQATVRAMLAESDADVVLVHDAARPFLPRAVGERVLAAARAAGAASACLRVTDTVVDVADGRALPRDELRRVQTPQAFARELLARAHAAAVADGVEATDDAALVTRLGVAVAWVEGSQLLHKLTTPEDLELGLALLDLWRSRRGGQA
ncbi:MAG: 2-C-methyl-D-erythritol 4-phosphate cytidylyltransferase [Trueperaceae bacterium]|nr:2-C-methyl-D-erythritol 4-phosphate cytidylyltransferase [Trueperaceae bacterium]